VTRAAVLACTLLGALALGLAGAEADDSTGVTATSILIGGTDPLTGPAAAFASVAYGADGYFKYVNDKGGVFGRTIKYEFLDDAFDPAQTVEQTRKLVEHDGVFAIFNDLGTEHAEAVAPYLNQKGVPQLFAGTGTSTLADGQRYPWTLPYLPSFRGEGLIYGRYLAQTGPKARIGVLYEDSDFGRDLLSGLRSGLGSHAKQIVSAQAYDVSAADVNSQIAALKSARVDTLMLFATPKAAIQGYIAAYKLGWRPHVFVSSVSIAPAIMDIVRASTNGRFPEGSISIAFIKDPTNLKKWGKDAGVLLYRRIMRKYEPGRNANDAYHEYGMAVAFTLVDALQHAGKDLTRESLMRAATSLSERNNPFLLPGIVVKTSSTDRHALEQAQLYRYHEKVWREFGPLQSAAK
jgi:branched-chain amino acid transport system substrate-binding protein